jgi:hypothetical protein
MELNMSVSFFGKACVKGCLIIYGILNVFLDKLNLQKQIKYLHNIVNL